jgi:hypothetical protein
MLSLRNKKVAGPLALLVALVVTTSIALASGGVASSNSSSAPAAASSAQRQVAHNGLGELRTRIVGQTASGRDVTGYFTPLKFTRRDGKLYMRALYHGVVHKSNGTTRTFDALRTKRVRPAVAPTASRTQAAAPCRVLNLVLGPLHLDLLGLEIDLNRVVLNIVAQSGAGNLLGNLVCALAGLLDGGLGGLLGRIANLLNRILTRLGLGI